MKDVVYVTGNAGKAKYFSDMVGINITHMKLDIDEIQSLDLREIVEHKAKQAYAQANKPVLVEDTKLSFTALGALPGPFIKWFIDELGYEGICRMLDGYDSRGAIAGAAIAYYDGVDLVIFEKEYHGTIADHPSGDTGFGWNCIFIPKGEEVTMADMSEADFMEFYARIKPFNELKIFLKTL